MRRRAWLPWLPLLGASLGLSLLAPEAVADEQFESHVHPLLAERCIKCHGPARQSGGLRLDSREAILKGGDSGPAAVSARPAGSLLLKVWDADTGRQMLSLKGARSFVYCVAFSPDGGRVLSGDGDGTSRIWSAD